MKRNNVLTLLLAGLVTSISGSAIASTLANDYVQVGYVYGDYADYQPFNLAGIEVEGSFAFESNLYIHGTYRTADDKANAINLDETNWKTGLGYVFDISQDTVIDTRFSYGNIKFELSNATNAIDASTHYYSLASKLRHQLTNSIEVYGGLEWQFWNEGSDQKAYSVGAQYAFGQAKALSVGVEYSKYSDSQWAKLFLRYAF